MRPWVEGSCNRLSWGRVFSPETHPVGEVARGKASRFGAFIVSSTESAVGSRSSSTIRPSARKNDAVRRKPHSDRA